VSEIEVDAATFDEAVEKIHALLPEGHQILSYRRLEY
jgi:hypothetical protein